MAVLIWIIGLVTCAAGVLFVIKAEAVRWFMRFAGRGQRVYGACVLRIVLAVVFLMGARECRVPWLIMAVGVLYLVGGVLCFGLGAERDKQILEWWQMRSSFVLRLLGVMVIVLGGLLVWGSLV